MKEQHNFMFEEWAFDSELPIDDFTLDELRKMIMGVTTIKSSGSLTSYIATPRDVPLFMTIRSGKSVSFWKVAEKRIKIWIDQ